MEVLSLTKQELEQKIKNRRIKKLCKYLELKEKDCKKIILSICELSYDEVQDWQNYVLNTIKELDIKEPEEVFSLAILSEHFGSMAGKIKSNIILGKEVNPYYKVEMRYFFILELKSKIYFKTLELLTKAWKENDQLRLKYFSKAWKTGWESDIAKPILKKYWDIEISEGVGNEISK